MMVVNKYFCVADSFRNNND